MNELFNPPQKGTARNYRHGHKWAGGASPEYITWNGMRARCTNPSDPNYQKYGARGIQVCDRWRESFVAFLQDMGRKPSPAHSIERIDNNGNYEPGNCRWATKSEQARNRRSSRLLTHRGQTMTLAAWAEEVGIGVSTIHARIKSGWPIERALMAPIRKRVA